MTAPCLPSLGEVCGACHRCQHPPPTVHLATVDGRIWDAFHTEAAETWAAAHAVATGETVYICHTNQEDQ